MCHVSKKTQYPSVSSLYVTLEQEKGQSISPEAQEATPRRSLRSAGLRYLATRAASLLFFNMDQLLPSPLSPGTGKRRVPAMVSTRFLLTRRARILLLGGVLVGSLVFVFMLLLATLPSSSSMPQYLSFYGCDPVAQKGIANLCISANSTQLAEAHASGMHGMAQGA
jgi:hypothetical protein